MRAVSHDFRQLAFPSVRHPRLWLRVGNASTIADLPRPHADDIETFGQSEAEALLLLALDT